MKNTFYLFLHHCPFLCFLILVAVSLPKNALSADPEYGQISGSTFRSSLISRNFALAGKTLVFEQIPSSKAELAYSNSDDQKSFQLNAKFAILNNLWSSNSKNIEMDFSKPLFDFGRQNYFLKYNFADSRNNWRIGFSFQNQQEKDLFDFLFTKIWSDFSLGIGAIESGDFYLFFRPEFHITHFELKQKILLNSTHFDLNFANRLKSYVQGFSSLSKTISMPNFLRHYLEAEWVFHVTDSNLAFQTEMVFFIQFLTDRHIGSIYGKGPLTINPGFSMQFQKIF